MQQQRELLSGQGPPKYIMPLEWVKQMIYQVQQANYMFKAWLSGQLPNSGAPRPPIPGPSQQQPGAPGGVAPPQMPAMANQQRANVAIPHPPTMSAIPPPSAASPPAPPVHTPSATAMSPRATGTPIQKKPTPKPVDGSSAPTPTHAANSPQTPQTPKTKPAQAKKPPQPKPRKASKIAPNPTPGPSEVKAPSTPAASTPAPSAPTPDATAGTKRPREEDASTPAGAAPAPAAKKIKTEWDEAASDVLAKRQADADNVKTDDDAMKFVSQMTSWLDQMGDQDGNASESIARELADVLWPVRGQGSFDTAGLYPRA